MDELERENRHGEPPLIGNCGKGDFVSSLISQSHLTQNQRVLAKITSKRHVASDSAVPASAAKPYQHIRFYDTSITLSRFSGLHLSRIHVQIIANKVTVQREETEIRAVTSSPGLSLVSAQPSGVGFGKRSRPRTADLTSPRRTPTVHEISRPSNA